MGCNSNVYFPAGTRVRNVADALGILGGSEKGMTDIPSVRVVGAGVHSTSVPEMAEIRWMIFTPKGFERQRSAYWHFETDKLMPLLSMTIRPWDQAAAVRLADLFGGKVILDDCEDKGYYDYSVDCPRPTNHPTNGEPWAELEWAIYNLSPITAEEERRYGSEHLFLKER